MLALSRNALLATAATVAAGLLAGPGTAYAADPSTALSAAEMAAALKAVGTASAKAAAPGWSAGVTLSGGSISGTELFVTDPVHRVAFERLSFGGHTITQYVAAGRGTYAPTADPESRAALKMMHRPAVRWVFTADRRATLDSDDMSPATLLTDDADHAGTRTSHDDGSTDYRLTADGTTMTVHVDAAGVLKSADANGDGVHMALTFSYGPQHVTLPAAGTTVSEATLAHGLAYLDMATTVRQVAGQAATDTLRAAHGRTVSAAALRKVAQRDARAANSAVGLTMLKTRNVRGGVRVYATNPWTHHTASYTLTAAGRKVTLARK